MSKKIIIGSRGSKLALLYAQQAKDKIIENTNLGNDDILIKSITTKGDELQNIRLSEVGGKGLFSSNIEKELQLKNIDIAVHALKDMPANETKGLITDSFLKRNDPREILITKNNKKLKDLDEKSIVGTSSFRREFQIKKIRKDLNCKLIRGNVDTRIRKLNEGIYDAIILSYAGIKFLKFENEISEIFSVEEIIPSAGQGIIALQCRENDIFQILIGIGIFLLFLVFRGLISKLVIKKLEVISKRTTNKLDDTFVQSLVGPARFLPIVLGFFIASYYMTFSLEGREVVDTINRTLITILIFWVIHQIIEPISYILSGLDKILTRELIGWIIKSLKILIFILGLAAVLELWGIKIGPIIAGLGLFGVAVALGAQDLFKNLISGILVLVEKRFKIGDWIAVEGIIEGIVEKIGFRSTTIRKFDKSLAIIPNFQFAENAVVNVSETSNWLISWIITLQYDTTVDQLKKIRDEIENHINSSEDYNTSIGVAVRVDKFSDSSIDMYVRCFTKSGSWSNWLDVKERLAIAIKEIVEKNGASFAFPSQSIYVEKK